MEKKRKDDELQAKLIAEQAEKDLKEQELADQKARRDEREREKTKRGGASRKNKGG